MAEFQPDVDALLQRFTIQKPNETFEVGPVAPDPQSSPSPLGKSAFTVPDQPQSQRLQDEAAKVQDIIDILKDTAPQIAVPVPPEEQPFLGTSITSNDYIASLENSDDLAQRKQQHFEAGVLSQQGDNPNWPILMLKDLVGTRNSLLSARDLSQGALLTAPVLGTVASNGVESWKSSLMQSDLSSVYDQAIQSSGKLRFKVAQTVFTLNASLQGSLVESLLTSTIDPQIEKIKPNISSLLDFLTKVRSLFTYSQLLLSREHVRSGQELLNALESEVIQKILNVLVVKLSDA